MTNIWMLSKESMKGMDLIEVLGSVLYALEQRSAKKRVITEEEILSSFRRGQALLNAVNSSLKAQTTKGAQIDLFMLSVAESLEKSLGLTPSKLCDRLIMAKEELGHENPSPETVELFQRLLRALMGMTSRSVGAISSSLH